jgi:hypothetical protein
MASFCLREKWAATLGSSQYKSKIGDGEIACRSICISSSALILSAGSYAPAESPGAKSNP